MLPACTDDPNPRRTHGCCRRACGFYDWCETIDGGQYGMGVENDGWRSRKLRRTADAITCRFRGGTLPAARYAVFSRRPVHTSFQRLKPCRRTRVWSTCAACENHFRNTKRGGCSKSRTTHVLPRVARNIILFAVREQSNENDRTLCHRCTAVCPLRYRHKELSLLLGL